LLLVGVRVGLETEGDGGAMGFAALPLALAAQEIDDRIAG